MHYPVRYSDLPEYAFPRLRRLLADVPQGGPLGGPEIAMSIGEPQHPVPDFVGPILLEHAATLSRYPPNEGIPELRHVQPFAAIVSSADRSDRG
jgi:N-succinyldiaminopimelate aminotransferase